MTTEAPKIRVLSSSLASQIAAGEVVERPSSAVKELVENSIDAGAERCDVAIQGGGITLLSVSDDGHGMSPADAELCVQRHATSKLTTFDDLNQIRTFGFRGEALPSIASVSRFRLTTRAQDSDAGTEVLIDAGATPNVRPCGRAIGTTIEVRDLFYNVPARRKFMRSSGTESSHIAETLEAAALARPAITFTLTRDGRVVREWLRVRTPAERVEQVVGEPDLAECAGERGPLKVVAFLSRPERARQGAAGLRLMVNNRPIRDRAIAATVAQAYGSVLERGRYPRGVVFVELPPQLVDVNVHPQKLEVRFADPRAVTDALYSILSRELARAFSLPTPARSPWVERRAEPLVRVGDVRQPLSRDAAGWPTAAAFTTHATPLAEPTDAAVATSPFAGTLWDRPSPPRSVDTTLSGDNGEARELSAREPASADDAPFTALDTRQGQATEAQDRSKLRYEAAFGDLNTAQRTAPSDANPNWSKLRFVAQVRQTYLLCEGDAGLYVLDQHAAAERVTFSRLRRDYASRAVPSQALLFPQNVEVTVEEAELIEQRADAILEVGLEVRRRSGDVVSVHAIPRLLHHASAERLLRDLLSELLRTGGRGFSDAVDRALATMACHGSVRAGDALSAKQVTALLEALDDTDFAGHCPHGRPIVTSLTWLDLERRVGRR